LIGFPLRPEHVLNSWKAVSEKKKVKEVMANKS